MLQVFGDCHIYYRYRIQNKKNSLHTLTLLCVVESVEDIESLNWHRVEFFKENWLSESRRAEERESLVFFLAIQIDSEVSSAKQGGTERIIRIILQPFPTCVGCHGAHRKETRFAS